MWDRAPFGFPGQVQKNQTGWVAGPLDWDSGIFAKKGPGGRARSQNENQLTTKTTNHTKKEADWIQVPDTDSSFVLFGSVVVKIGLLSHLEKVHATAVPFSTKVNDGFEFVFPSVLGDTPKVFPPLTREMLSRLHTDPKEHLNGSSLSGRSGGTTANPRLCGLPWVTCSKRLTANPSERRQWQDSLRELTTKGFLRVGLRWFYHPNVSSKQIPNTSFFLISNFFHYRFSTKGPGLRGCLPQRD